MSQPTRRARRAALRTLYAIDLSGLSATEALSTLREALNETDDDLGSDWDQVVATVTALTDDLERLDQEIAILSPSWRVERMAAVDRNLLRLGIFEILQRATPPLITINACVELAKEFGAASTPGFINGLLDQLCQNHEIPI